MNTMDILQKKRTENVGKGVFKSLTMYSELRSEGYEDMERDLIFLSRFVLPKGGIM